MPANTSTKLSTVSSSKVVLSARGTSRSSATMARNRMNESTWSMIPLPPGRADFTTSA